MTMKALRKARKARNFMAECRRNSRDWREQEKREYAAAFPAGATVENITVAPRPAREDDMEKFDDRLVEALHPDIVVERSHRGARPVFRKRTALDGPVDTSGQ